MIDVIKRIKELMEKRGWTCYELSAQTGISTNAIYDWFKIGAEPSLSNIVKICEAMGISLELFFCGETAYQLTDDENKILHEWLSQSDLEKKAVHELIEYFHILKSER